MSFVSITTLWGSQLTFCRLKKNLSKRLNNLPNITHLITLGVDLNTDLSDVQKSVLYPSAFIALWKMWEMRKKNYQTITIAFFFLFLADICVFQLL